MAVLEDFEGLEYFRLGFWQLLDITNNLEWAFKYGIFVNVHAVASNNAAYKLAIAISVKLNHALASAFEWSLKEHLTAWIDHNCSFIAKRNNFIADMS